MLVAICSLLAPKPRKTGPVRAMIVLGSGQHCIEYSTAQVLHTYLPYAMWLIWHTHACLSGGHTAEMLRVLAALDKGCYKPRIYVYAHTDEFSASKAQDAEKSYQADVSLVRHSMLGI